MEKHEKSLQLTVVSLTDVSMVSSVVMQRQSLKVSVLLKTQYERQEV